MIAMVGSWSLIYSNQLAQTYPLIHKGSVLEQFILISILWFRGSKGPTAIKPD